MTETMLIVRPQVAPTRVEVHRQDPPNLTIKAGIHLDNNATVAYTHHQTTPSLVWTVQHGLGYNPAGISIVDLDGNPVEESGRSHPSSNVVLLTFIELTAGEAKVS